MLLGIHNEHALGYCWIDQSGLQSVLLDWTGLDNPFQNWIWTVSHKFAKDLNWIENQINNTLHDTTFHSLERDSKAIPNSKFTQNPALQKENKHINK